MDATMILPILISFAVSAALGPVVIPLLRRLKFGQTERDDGPKSHLKKTGTPTMGGLMILAGITITSLIYVKDYPQIIPVLFVTVGFGIIGFLAGLIFRRKREKWKRYTVWLCLYGGLATLVIYGFLMDTASVFMGMGAVQETAFLAMYISGFPMNVIHGTASVIFLAILGKPVMRKLDRIKKKYGILEP